MHQVCKAVPNFGRKIHLYASHHLRQTDNVYLEIDTWIELENLTFLFS